MQRQRPFFSIFGLIFTLLLLAGLGWMIRRSGGQTFSPGRLSAVAEAGLRLGGFSSHAEFEAECAYCHQPLETVQDPLCLECHQDIAGELDGNGLHTRFTEAPRCATCHSEHHGRDFDPTRAALVHFDHAWADFSLAWHQISFNAGPMDCFACHTGQGHFELDIHKCTECHGLENASFMIAHIQDFSDDCLVCHDGLDTLASFDHKTTGFPLQDRHAELKCAGCHQPAESSPNRGGRGGGRAVLRSAGDLTAARQANFFQPLTGDCRECHQEPQAHRGLFAGGCQECHNQDAWTPAFWQGTFFNHEGLAFSLARHPVAQDGQPLACLECHRAAEFQAAGQAPFDPAACSACHGQGEEGAVFMTGHLERFGPDCLTCHDGRDRLSDFDHNLVFPLVDGHSDPDCQACHAGYDFRRNPRACVECHAEPALHAGFFGLQCDACHTAAGWVPAQLRRHAFRLDHGRPADSACETCHSGPYTEYTCYTCHEHQPEAVRQSHLVAGIPEGELADCTACHLDGR